jgi:DNA-binding NtrC family response regulator
MYRVRVIPLFLPPLRDRRGDIGLIAGRFIEHLNDRYRRHVERLGRGALAALESYDWPGNVRELLNALEYAFAIGRGPVLTEAELPPEILLGEEPAAGSRRPAMPVEVPDAAELSPEARRLLRALQRSGGHKRRAAESLGMSRTTFWRKLREHGLEGAGG